MSKKNGKKNRLKALLRVAAFSFFLVGIIGLLSKDSLGFLFLLFSAILSAVLLFLHRKAAKHAPGLIRISIYNSKTRYYGFKRVIAFDVETTGLDPQSDRIIELSAVVFEQPSDPVNSFSTLINPGIHIPDSASKINHIYDEDVYSAPSERQAMRAFVQFINHYNNFDIPLILVAHNARFDVGFIENALSRSRLSISGFYVDTLSGARQLLPNLGSYRLSDVADYFNIDCSSAHRAYSDAYVCGKIFRHLCSMAIRERQKSPI